MSSPTAREPVLTWAAVAGAINAGQAPVTLPWWAHVLIAIASTLLAGHQARRRVTPTP